jgi:hypothetical protein
MQRRHTLRWAALVELSLVTVLEEVAHHVDEAAVIHVGAVGRALHEEAPVRVALGGVGGVGLAQLPVIVQEGRELCAPQRRGEASGKVGGKKDTNVYDQAR